LSREKGPGYTLEVSGAVTFQSPELEAALQAFHSQLQLLVAEHSPHGVFVHAGVVQWKQRALVIPGTSFSGKTTLVLELLRRGASYLSDEYAVFDREGQVHPYHRPLQVRLPEGGANRIDPQSMGFQLASGPLPLGWVVATHYQRGCRWEPHPISPAKAVLAMFAHTVSARRDPRRALSWLSLAARGAWSTEGPRGGAKAAARHILDNCRSRRYDINDGSKRPAADP
jgi:hypothetical protein